MVLSEWSGLAVSLTYVAHNHRAVRVEPECLLVIHVMPHRFCRRGPMSSRKYVAGPDIDLDVEVVRDRKGRRITEKRAEQLAAEALAKAGVSRPSLTAPGARSPEVKARVPAALRDRLVQAARERGAKHSALIGEALERYLAS